ncbi:hypothetical protein B4135_0336 [Caldibacillus debilis]|jgi:hypothetical protein|uniref:Uncharacterized protein n=1 Tax=Caldibacillus debilis TaxID=301148 RepID=A0A150M5E7_9BACI|nr:hypothetical protein B4135_0336 [Caldibacillus debilis]
MAERMNWLGEKVIERQVLAKKAGPDLTFYRDCLAKFGRSHLRISLGC